MFDLYTQEYGEVLGLDSKIMYVTYRNEDVQSHISLLAAKQQASRTRVNNDSVIALFDPSGNQIARKEPGEDWENIKEVEMVTNRSKVLH